MYASGSSLNQISTEEHGVNSNCRAMFDQLGTAKKSRDGYRLATVTVFRFVAKRGLLQVSPWGHDRNDLIFSWLERSLS